MNIKPPFSSNASDGTRFRDGARSGRGDAFQRPIVVGVRGGGTTTILPPHPINPPNIYHRPPQRITPVSREEGKRDASNTKPPPFAATLPHHPAAKVPPPGLPPHPINRRNAPPVVNPYAPVRKPVINPYTLQKPTNVSPPMNATAAIQAASAMPVNNSVTSAHKPTTLFQNRKVSRRLHLSSKPPSSLLLCFASILLEMQWVTVFPGFLCLGHSPCNLVTQVPRFPGLLLFLLDILCCGSFSWVPLPGPSPVTWLPRFPGLLLFFA